MVVIYKAVNLRDTETRNIFKVPLGSSFLGHNLKRTLQALWLKLISSMASLST